MSYPLALGMPGLTEWLVIGLIGLLLFGKRLPEVGRSIGKMIVEFKKGLNETQDAVSQAGTETPPADASQPQAALPPGAKFDPITGKPLAQSAEPAPTIPPANTPQA